MPRPREAQNQRDFELLPSAYFESRDFHTELFANSSLWDVLPKVQDYLNRLTNLQNRIEGEVDSTSQLIGNGIVIEKGAKVEGAVIRGPVIIESGAYIGHAALIRENTVIGRNSVVGHCTEIKSSILFPDAHAAHFNFIGDSIIGSHVNIGGGTILSNYEFRSVSNPEHTIAISHEGKISQTGLKKLGSIVGDSANIGSNCTLSPGSIIRRGAVIYPETLVNKGFFPPYNINEEIGDLTPKEQVKPGERPKAAFVTFRTEETERKYQEARAQRQRENFEGCVLCLIPDDESFPSMRYWRVVENEFPYDKIAEKSWILMTKRCVSQWDQLTADEKAEFQRFRSEAGKYDVNVFMWGTSINQSIPGHYDEHLLKLPRVKEK